jgi:hypothetical protein
MSGTIEFEPTSVKSTKFFTYDKSSVETDAIVDLNIPENKESVSMYDNDIPSIASDCTFRSYELYIDVTVEGDGVDGNSDITNIPKVATRTAKVTEDDSDIADYDLLITNVESSPTNVSDFTVTVQNISGYTADIRLVVVGEI